MTSPVRMSMCESRFNLQRTRTAWRVDAGMVRRDAIDCGESRLRHRRSTILRTFGAGVRCRGAVRAVMRAAGSVDHCGLAHLVVADRPPFGGGPRDVEMLRGSDDRPALVDDAPGQQQPALRGQSCVSVDPEGLLSV